ncbi:hypothetical protein GE061_004615 [Apolygus lucorum]|uniref:Uncharacterized protein n=1 Tax=Apolygus lucorum TaxID=248454 RepID=A0A8S9WZT0_APOLU|nr:hypothetical protein GE061_004615 [Apolygus lucorum]
MCFTSVDAMFHQAYPTSLRYRWDVAETSENIGVFIRNSFVLDTKPTTRRQSCLLDEETGSLPLHIPSNCLSNIFSTSRLLRWLIIISSNVWRYAVVAAKGYVGNTSHRRPRQR